MRSWGLDQMLTLHFCHSGVRDMKKVSFARLGFLNYRKVYLVKFSMMAKYIIIGLELMSE